MASLDDTAIHGVLIACHGKLVREEYFHGFDRARVHGTRSAANSITATMVGAAIQRAARLAASTRVYDLLYRGAPPALDARKLDMTVEHRWRCAIRRADGAIAETGCGAVRPQAMCLDAPCAASVSQRRAVS